MDSDLQRWRKAQAAEIAFWETAQMRHYVFRNIQDGHYTRIAERYWQWVAPIHPLDPTSHILEVGSAAIGVINYMKMGDRWAIDPLAHYFVREFHDLLAPGVQLVCAIGEAMPFLSCQFDVVLCAVLNHVITPKLLLQEVWRVLAPGGVLLMSTVVHSPATAAFLWFRETAERFIKYPGRKDSHFYTVPSLRRLIESCRFQVLAGQWEEQSSILPNDEMQKFRGRRWEMLSRK